MSVVPAYVADVVVVGAGRMGALHAQTVASCAETRLVGVHDQHPERAEALAERFGCGAGLCRADLYIVATPASSHAEVASPLLSQGYVLVEKPLSPAWTDLWEHPRALAAWSERFHRHWVGREVRHTFRSNRGRASRATDVHPVLDLMVHDLDLLCWKTTGVEVLQVEAPWVTLRFDGGTATLGLQEGPSRLEVDGVVLRRAGPPDPLTRQLRAVLDQMRTGRGALRAGASRRTLDLAQMISCAWD